MNATISYTGTLPPGEDTIEEWDAASPVRVRVPIPITVAELLDEEDEDGLRDTVDQALGVALGGVFAFGVDYGRTAELVRAANPPTGDGLVLWVEGTYDSYDQG